MLKQTLLYTGKAKSVYTTDSEDHLILVFRDDAS
ncbi:phosphoribosylaminoimidazolesuccinocarboxamide synthase, partial [Acinetobacter sp. UBA3025]